MVRHHGTEDNTLGQTIVQPTALGPVANTDTKLLIYGLFQKGRVLAQDGIVGPFAKVYNPHSILQPFRSFNGSGVHFLSFSRPVAHLSGASAMKCWWLPRNPFAC